jgi:type IV secretion system protein VirD4
VALEERSEGTAHLPQVRNILNYGAEDFKGLLKHMSGLASGQGKIAGAANRMLQKADKEFSSVVSTAQRHTHFLDSGRMAKTLTRSDFSLFDIKKKPMTVYLVLPADRISTHNRWLRLVVSMAMAAMARTPGRPKPPVLFLLDEFAALGKLDMVETAAGLMRGYGLKLWPILQDLPQLQAKYPKGWESFIGNAGAMQLFGVNDKQTAEYFSKKIGAETILLHSKSSSGHGASESEHAGGRALIMPDEIIRMDKNHLLALFQGRQPAMLDKLRYYSDPAFKGMFDPNPYL